MCVSGLRALIAAHPDRPSLRLHLADWHRMRGVMLMELDERRASLAELRQAVRWSRITRKDVVCLAALLLPSALRDHLLARRRASKRET